MISKEEVQSLADLARLKVSDAELQSLEKDISSILEYVGQVSSVSTAQGTMEVPPLHNVLRDDRARSADDPLAGKEEAIRKEFPARKGDWLSVQKILQKDE